MISYDNVQIKNAMNVAFLMCRGENGIYGLSPVYFHVGYKSKFGEKVDNLYVEDGDGGGYPRILVNILESVKIINKEFVEVSVEVMGGNLYLREDKGESMNKSEVEVYGEVYGMVARFWAYLNGMKHGKRGVKSPCFQMGDLEMMNDGYVIGDEVLVVEGKFKMVVQKPKSWDCWFKNWGSGEVPSFLNGMYNPNEENPFKNFDMEFFKK